MRLSYNMDYGWKFHRGDVEVKTENSHSDSYTTVKAGSAIGPAAKTYFDTDWREVQLPHDYYAESEFGPENLHSHGYRERCNAWYRKSFVLPQELSGRQLLLHFEGTAVHAEFYFNGSLMARTFSAYTETVIDITDRAYTDGRVNVLAVRINGLATEGWWYEGAGIYRHVHLYAKSPVHIAHNGSYMKPVRVSKNVWNVEAQAELENSFYTDETIDGVLFELLDGDNVIASARTRAMTVPKASGVTVNAVLKVTRPRIWDVDAPNLYTVRTSVLKDGNAVDGEDTRIGFREFYVTAEKGFFLNGRNIRIKGTCNHQDHAGVGTAIPDNVNYWRIKRLKEMGTNAYRCSHNLPTRAVLDACDELGMIVMDENRMFETRTEVQDNVRQMVKRDRNHPSVVFWSLFNEEPLQNTEEGSRIFRRLKSEVLKLDDTRLVTGAINGNMEHAGLDADITGINYHISRIEEMHALHPEHPIMGSENNSAVTTRGCYLTDREGAHVLANYDEETVPWGETVRETWDFVLKHDWFAGIFIWTGFDYRGEPTPFTWPSVSSQFGIMDTCGFAKDSFFYNKACFTDKPMVHLLPHWNHKKGDMVRVAAATNCDEVELFLNGKSLGRKSAGVIDTPDWQVEYARGRITAKGYRNGKCVAKDEQRTTGKPYAIELEVMNDTVYDDGNDTVIVNVYARDKKGLRVPTANDLIRFTVEGDAEFLGAGNGDPNSHESDKAPFRRLYQGACQLLVRVRQGGKSVRISADGDGLEGAFVEPAIIHRDADLVIGSVNMTMVNGFTMSDVTPEKPDPAHVYTQDDMNSLDPVTFDAKQFQPWPREGWRLYRAFLSCGGKAGEMNDFALSFTDVRVPKMEVYINGECVLKLDSTDQVWGLVQCPFRAMGMTKAELRVLIYARPDERLKEAGLRHSVCLEEK